MSDEPDNDWENLRIRRPRAPERDEAASRFWLGVALVALGALIFPWYAYWVGSFLLQRGLEAVALDFQQKSDAASQQMAAGLAAAQARSRADAVAMRVQSEAYAQRNRIAQVRVMGASTNGAQPIVLVQLGNAGVEEASEVICRQARYWLNHNVSGVTLRV